MLRTSEDESEKVISSVKVGCIYHWAACWWAVVTDVRNVVYGICFVCLFYFHSSYLLIFCLTQSFLLNPLILHFNKTIFLQLEILLILLKRSGQALKLVWVQQLKAYPGLFQSICNFCWLPCSIGTLRREKIGPENHHLTNMFSDNLPQKQRECRSSSDFGQSLWYHTLTVSVWNRNWLLLSLKLVHFFHSLQGFVTS